MSLSNKEIKIELEKEDSTKYKSINSDQSTKNLNILAATNQELLTNSKKVIYNLIVLTNKIYQIISPDLENTNQDKLA